MRKVSLFLTVAILLVAAVSTSYAQTPVIQVFFDEAGTIGGIDCPPGGGIDSLYVVARNFNAAVDGIQFAVNYPASMTYVSDFNTQPVTLGSTATGVAMGWPIPQNGFNDVMVCGVIISWNCNDCSAPDDPIVVVDHPFLGAPGCTRFGDQLFITAVGMTALVCPTVPSEETSWGRVKELYQN